MTALHIQVRNLRVALNLPHLVIEDDGVIFLYIEIVRMIEEIRYALVKLDPWYVSFQVVIERLPVTKTPHDTLKSGLDEIRKQQFFGEEGLAR